VGVTRAKERIYLLHTFRRTLYGESKVREPSRFLRDIPQQLVRGRERTRAPRQESLGLEAGRFRTQTRTGFTSFSPQRRAERPAGERPARPVPSGQPAPSAPRFQTGDEVQHEVFGQGVVIESKSTVADEQVTVAFAGVGIKRLMASMAPMEKVEEAG
jgi:DNA helicase-2/ATP-dependent DNA helicase PcrA